MVAAAIVQLRSQEEDWAWVRRVPWLWFGVVRGWEAEAEAVVVAREEVGRWEVVGSGRAISGAYIWGMLSRGWCGCSVGFGAYCRMQTEAQGLS